jgi:hypothetical protein
MIQEDEQLSQRIEKLKEALEAAIATISGKFKIFELEGEVLDDAMDSMDIDPEICMCHPSTHAHTHFAEACLFRKSCAQFADAHALHRGLPFLEVMRTICG